MIHMNLKESSMGPQEARLLGLKRKRMKGNTKNKSGRLKWLM